MLLFDEQPEIKDAAGARTLTPGLTTVSFEEDGKQTKEIH